MTEEDLSFIHVTDLALCRGGKRLFWRLSFGLLLGMLVVTLPGCSRKADAPPPPDFSVHVSDAQGLGVGSAVQWRGIEVGRVDSVATEKGLIRIYVQLHEPHRGQFRDGLRARPTRGFMSQGAAVLELYGGSDLGKAVLAPGAQIPEATLTDTITPGQWRAVGLLMVAVILFLVVLRIIRKLVALALALALLVFAGWFMHRQWQRHGEELLAARTEMRWSELARNMLTEEAAQEAWIVIQADLAGAVREVGEIGKERVAKETAELRARMELRATTLAEEGKTQAAEEIRKLQDAILGTSRSQK